MVLQGSDERASARATQSTEARMKKIDGKRIANAAHRLRIDVTAEDIRNGRPLNHNACAIAVAVKRQVPKARNVFTHLGTLYVEIEGRGWLRWHVPEYATREITAFDRGGRFVPTEIDFTPLPIVSFVKKRRASSGPSKRPRRVKRHYTEGVRQPAYTNEPPAKKG